MIKEQLFLFSIKKSYFTNEPMERGPKSLYPSICRSKIFFLMEKVCFYFLDKILKFFQISKRHFAIIF